MNPLRFNSLLGGARASRAMDSTESARAFYHQLLNIADPESKREALAEARSFLAK